MAIDLQTFYYEVFLNKIVSSAIIFLLGFGLANIVGKLTKRVMQELEVNKLTGKRFRFNFEKNISKIITYLIYLTTILLILKRLEITSFVWKGILIFLVILAVSALLLDLKDLLPNLIAYRKIKKNKYFSKNDEIKTPIAQGIVEKVSLISTKITTDKGDELYIPNQGILENLVVKKKKK